MKRASKLATILIHMLDPKFLFPALVCISRKDFTEPFKAAIAARRKK
jgi:hypothetical protein